MISPSYPRDYPFVMSHGRGTDAWDVDGNHFLILLRVLPCARPVTLIRKWSLQSAKRRGSSCTFPAIIGMRGWWAWRSVWHALTFGEPAMSFFCQSGTEVGRRRAEARALRQRPAAIHRLSRGLSRSHDGLACVHLEQVHTAEGVCTDDARGDARAVSEFL